MWMDGWMDGVCSPGILEESTKTHLGVCLFLLVPAETRKKAESNGEEEDWVESRGKG